MKYIKQEIPDILLIEPEVYSDERGYFAETFRNDELSNALGYDINFIQDNESKSNKGVLRGLHFQIPPYAQSKLVRVIQGDVLDVAVDIRKNSPTFGKHVSAKLTSDNFKQMFIPHGFAHGFVVLSETAIFSYKVDQIYSPDNERGLKYDDQDLKINWTYPKENLILSDKDLSQPELRELKDYFFYKGSDCESC